MDGEQRRPGKSGTYGVAETARLNWQVGNESKSTSVFKRTFAGGSPNTSLRRAGRGVVSFTMRARAPPQRFTYTGVDYTGSPQELARNRDPKPAAKEAEAPTPHPQPAGAGHAGNGTGAEGTAIEEMARTELQVDRRAHKAPSSSVPRSEAAAKGAPGRKPRKADTAPRAKDHGDTAPGAKSAAPGLKAPGRSGAAPTRAVKASSTAGPGNLQSLMVNGRKRPAAAALMDDDFLKGLDSFCASI